VPLVVLVAKVGASTAPSAAAAFYREGLEGGNISVARLDISEHGVNSCSRVNEWGTSHPKLTGLAQFVSDKHHAEWP